MSCSLESKQAGLAEWLNILTGQCVRNINFSTLRLCSYHRHIKSIWSYWLFTAVLSSCLYMILSLAEIPHTFHLSPSRFIKRWEMTDNIYLVCTPHWDLALSASLHCNDGCLKTPFTVSWKMTGVVYMDSTKVCYILSTQGSRVFRNDLGCWRGQYWGTQPQAPQAAGHAVIWSATWTEWWVSRLALFNAEIPPTAKLRIWLSFD